MSHLPLPNQQKFFFPHGKKYFFYNFIIQKETMVMKNMSSYISIDIVYRITNLIRFQNLLFVQYNFTLLPFFIIKFMEVVLCKK